MYALEDILGMIFWVSQPIFFDQLLFHQLFCCDWEGRFLSLVVMLGAVARLGEAGDICGVFGDYPPSSHLDTSVFTFQLIRFISS